MASCLSELQTRIEEAIVKSRVASTNKMQLGWQLSQQAQADSLHISDIYSGRTDHLDIHRLHKLESKINTLRASLIEYHSKLNEKLQALSESETNDIHRSFFVLF